MEELRYKKREEVEPIGTFEKVIMFKPRLAPAVCLITGILLMFVNNIGVRILAGFFILMALLVIILVKDYKVMDIFSDGVMVYNDRIGEYCCFIKYEDIKIWEVKYAGGQNMIVFEMNDGSFVERESFQADKARRVFMKRMREKELKYIKAKRSSEKPLNIKETFNVIKDKFLNK